MSLELDLSGVTTKRPAIKSRKNLNVVGEIITKIKNKKDGRKPGSIITSREVEDVVRKSNLTHLWQSSGSSKDTLGLRRSIGDLLGGHGLGLKKTKKGYVIPNRMPVLDGDDLVEKAIYNA